MPSDIPSPIDLRSMSDAVAWEAAAMGKRPWRVEFFDAVADAIRGADRVLELGSGPGFLACHLLERVPALGMVLLDFSPAMHELARKRLGALAVRADFVVRDFRQASWTAGLGEFDAVVTHQAVHELRHKRHAAALHAQVRSVLRPDGCYLDTDHFAGEGGMDDTGLYMRPEEQREALERAGFATVREVMRKGGLVLHHAI